MKKMRKLLSIVLAVAMVMSLAVSVGANTTTDSSADTSSTQYTITIQNAEEGETYKAYKIFDVTYSGNNYSYTINTSNPFYGAISKACGENGSLSSYLTLTPSASDSSVYVVEYKGSTETEDDFMEKLSAVIKSVIDDSDVTTTPAKTITASATANTLDVTDSGAGYYYVNTTVSSVVALTTTDPTVTIEEKWKEPTVEKGVYNDAPDDDPTVEDANGSYDTTGGTEGGTVGDSDAEIGETVYFKTTINNIYEVSNLVLHDYMEGGLELDKSSIVVTLYEGGSGTGTLVLTAESTEETENYDYELDTDPTHSASGGGDSWTECTFEITFDTAQIAASAASASSSFTVTEDSYIVVTYSAKVTEDAEIYGESSESSDGHNDNTTYVSYGEASYTTSDTTKTYVYSVNIFKYTGDSVASTASLAGAEFQIYYEESGTKYYAVLTGDSAGNYTLGSSGSYWSTEKTDGTTITTDSNGFIYIEGLDANKTYYLVETKAPDGYNLLSDPIAFKIIGSDPDGADTQGLVYIGTSASKISKYSITSTDGDSTMNNVIAVENESGSELPSTGGIGVTIFYVVGGILILAAAGVIVINRKKTKAEK